MKKEFLITCCTIAAILSLTTRCAHAASYFINAPLTARQAARILIHSPHRHIIQCQSIGNGETSCKEVRIATRLFPMPATVPHHSNQKARGEK